MVESSKSSKKKLVLVVIVVLVGLIGGGYFFVSRSSAGADDAASPSTTQPGRVVRLAPTTLNLTDGRVLKVGVALQTVAKPKDKVGGHARLYTHAPAITTPLVYSRALLLLQRTRKNQLSLHGLYESIIESKQYVNDIGDGAATSELHDRRQDDPKA